MKGLFLLIEMVEEEEIRPRRNVLVESNAERQCPEEEKEDGDAAERG